MSKSKSKKAGSDTREHGQEEVIETSLLDLLAQLSKMAREVTDNQIKAVEKGLFDGEGLQMQGEEEGPIEMSRESIGIIVLIEHLKLELEKARRRNHSSLPIGAYQCPEHTVLALQRIPNDLIAQEQVHTIEAAITIMKTAADAQMMIDLKESGVLGTIKSYRALKGWKLSYRLLDS